jgi:hypothetical protein
MLSLWQTPPVCVCVSSSFSAFYAEDIRYLERAGVWVISGFALTARPEWMFALRPEREK